MFEEEVFEITDFTTSSDWERFVSNVEEVIRQWDLCSSDPQQVLLQPPLKRGSFIHGKWAQKYETIKFAKIPFTVTYHYLDDEQTNIHLIEYDSGTNKEENQSTIWSTASNDMMSKENDFPAKAHCLVRWYGIRSFIILSPAGNHEAINTEDRIKMLLSSACIALNNTNCCQPFFIQINQRMRRYYHGVHQSIGLRTDYDMIHFREIPGNYRYLSELLYLFKEKLQSPLSELPPVQLSIRFTHALKEWPHGWQDQSASEETDGEEIDENDSYLNISLSSFHKLIWVCSEEPILELQLSTTWPSLSEEVVVDSPVHSDLDPLNAPKWSIRVLFKEALRCSMSESLQTLVSLKRSGSADKRMDKLIAETDVQENEIEIKQAFSRLTNPSPLSVPLPHFSRLKWNRPKWIKEQCINSIFSENTSENDFANIDIRGVKSAPINCLTWRVALKLCNIYASYKELADIAYMWKEIVSELRNYWESCKPLPHLVSEAPNLGTCLLHQKLQMLNCCIEQKINQETRKYEAIKNRKGNTGDESDEEFFDCPEEQLNEETVVFKAEGRSTQCGDLMLLNVNEPLYIPITQEPTPMTEDMLQEHSRILSQLGTSAESAALRAKMQCASLLSDMESFKAANPGACIEDFIRWHSPRDWIEGQDPSDNKKGQLSSRMQNPGNMWHEVWEAAKPVPAHRQKRLFDYTTEAEKILHYFASLSVTNLVDLLMPIIIHCGIIQVLDKRQELSLTQEEIPFDKDLILSYCHDSDFDSAISLIKENELRINQFESVFRKFSIANDLEMDRSKNKPEDIRKIVLNLIKEPEVEFPAFSYYAKLVRRMFLESQMALYESNTSVGERDLNEEKALASRLPYPIAKEFILRVCLPRPSLYSREVPQRMYCLMSKGEFRLAGAFSEDITYF